MITQVNRVRPNIQIEKGVVFIEFLLGFKCIWKEHVRVCVCARALVLFGGGIWALPLSFILSVSSKLSDLPYLLKEYQSISHGHIPVSLISIHSWISWHPRFWCSISVIPSASNGLVFESQVQYHVFIKCLPDLWRWQDFPQGFQQLFIYITEAFNGHLFMFLTYLWSISSKFR